MQNRCRLRLKPRLCPTPGLNYLALTRIYMLNSLLKGLSIPVLTCHCPILDRPTTATRLRVIETLNNKATSGVQEIQSVHDEDN